MAYKIFFRVCLCCVLLTIASCSTPQSAQSPAPVPAGSIDETKAQPPANQVPADQASDAVISLGDQELTKQHL